MGTASAWWVTALGKPSEVLRLREVERPRPRAGEVLVRLRAAALNYADQLLLQGSYQERPNLPFVPGFEVAGEVVEVGEGSELEGGALVMGHTEPPEGAYQELVRLPEVRALPVPEGMPLEEAGSFHIAFTTALAALRLARIEPREALLVLGAAGAVGSAAVQLGVALGARVVALARGRRSLALCSELGAHLVVDAEGEGLSERLGVALGPDGAHVVLDPLGGELFDLARRHLAFGGRLVVLGFAGGEVPVLALNRPLLGNYSILGLYFTEYLRRRPDRVRELHLELLELYRQGAIRPRIGARLDFEELAQGLALLAERDRPGRVVLLRS